MSGSFHGNHIRRKSVMTSLSVQDALDNPPPLPQGCVPQPGYEMLAKQSINKCLLPDDFGSILNHTKSHYFASCFCSSQMVQLYELKTPQEQLSPHVLNLQQSGGARSETLQELPSWLYGNFPD